MDLLTVPRTRSRTGKAKTQLTPDDWIHAATRLLVEGSVDAVRVDVLAKQLNVTRGSFYWHFQDRDELLRFILLKWRERATERIIDRLKKHEAEPKEIIRELIDLPFRGGAAAQQSSPELAIRAWARRDERARQAVDEVDEQRLTYITNNFRALGFAPPEARARAFMLYAYEITESLLYNQGTDKQKAERKSFIEKTLLAIPEPRQ